MPKDGPGLAILMEDDHKVPEPDSHEEMSGFSTAFEEYYKAQKEGEYETAKTALKSLIEMVVHEYK